MQGQVRQPGDSQRYEDAPLWMRTVMNNSAAYADFCTDMAVGIARCNELIAEFLDRDDPGSAKKMLGKREALKEMFHLLEGYRREEVNNG